MCYFSKLEHMADYCYSLLHCLLLFLLLLQVFNTTNTVRLITPPAQHQRQRNRSSTPATHPEHHPNQHHTIFLTLATQKAPNAPPRQQGLNTNNNVFKANKTTTVLQHSRSVTPATQQVFNTNITTGITYQHDNRSYQHNNFTHQHNNSFYTQT